MKASELIERLQKLMEEHGDLECEDDDEYVITRVEYGIFTNDICFLVY